jgi:hypothetical protein
MMQAIRRFWARSVLNKITLLMSFSLIFCCCGWTGRVGGEAPGRTASSALPSVEVSERPRYRTPGW